MAHFLSIAVHSSIGMKRDEYRFIYKDTQLKYTPRQKHSESRLIDWRVR